MRAAARHRIVRVASWGLFAVSLAAMLAVFAAAVSELAEEMEPSSAGTDPAPPGGTAPVLPAEPAPEGRTGRICLMALGTHAHYRLQDPARVDLVVVSPETRPANVLKKARKAHPEAKVFAYLNTMDIMLSRAEESPSFWKEREEWFLHDSDGQRVRVRVRGYRGEQSRYAMNVAHTGYQAYLGEKVVRFFKMGYDGVQLDNVETAYSYKPRYVGRFISALPVEMTEEGWYAGETEMLRRIRAVADEAGYIDSEIIFNHIRAGEPDISMQYLAQVDGANAEAWMERSVQPEGRWGWRARVDLARRAARAGKRTNLLCPTERAGRQEALFAFASYLMAKESDRNTFWYGKPYRAEIMPWFGFYDIDLGWPAGEMRETDGGAFIRLFGKGAVLVNPQDSPARVELERPFWNDLYEEVRSLELDPKSGALLMTPGEDAPPRWSLEAEACLPSPPEGAAPHGSLRRLEGTGFSERAAVLFQNTTDRCTLRISLAPGAYRVAVEGAGAGPKADAAFLRVGESGRRVAFDASRRVIFDVHAPRAIDEVEIRGAEAGVTVDRVLLIRLGDLP